MRNISIILKREFNSYFSTPIAYVFIVIFLILSGSLTFYMGNFFQREQADLIPFFSFHPWLYLFLHLIWHVGISFILLKYYNSKY